MRYKPGTKVRFRDNAGNVRGPSGTMVVAEGRVNGRPIQTDGGTVYVPVWVERDRGREATTLMVVATNILEVVS